jgi:cell division protease FtsH
VERHHKFSIWYVILGIWLVLLVQNALVSMIGVQTIPYSQFLKLLQENKITQVAVSANEIQGKMLEAGGTERGFRTVRVDPDLSKLLQERNIKFYGQIESNFIPTLLSWIVPVLLFFGLWYFLMKRISGQQPGFMMLGKNKAKIYMQEDMMCASTMSPAWTRPSRSLWRWLNF